MTLSQGTRLGAYEVVAPLGAGGMGEVYRARDTRLGRDVALKVLPDAFAQDLARLARFEQEARAASALNHPNIVTVHEIGREGETTYIAMELVDGKTLRDLTASGPLPVQTACDHVLQACVGVAEAHALSIVHRDLKPANLFLTRRPDGTPLIKVLDFGIAKAQGDTSFHLTNPAFASTYAVPARWRDAGLRRYGFHGTSHKYVVNRAAKEIDRPLAGLQIISIHLGNGASVCAVNRGHSMDSSMGMTPLEGLVMGTRSGDVDPGVFGFLERTSRGRVATARAYAYFGLTAPGKERLW